MIITREKFRELFWSKADPDCPLDIEEKCWDELSKFVDESPLLKNPTPEMLTYFETKLLERMDEINKQYA